MQCPPMKHEAPCHQNPSSFMSSRHLAEWQVIWFARGRHYRVMRNSIRARNRRARLPSVGTVPAQRPTSDTNHEPIRTWRRTHNASAAWQVSDRPAQYRSTCVVPARHDFRRKHPQRWRFWKSPSGTCSFPFVFSSLLGGIPNATCVRGDPVPLELAFSCRGQGWCSLQASTSSITYLPRPIRVPACVLRRLVQFDRHAFHPRGHRRCALDGVPAH